jgi:hypothetical protein
MAIYFTWGHGSSLETGGHSKSAFVALTHEKLVLNKIVNEVFDLFEVDGRVSETKCADGFTHRFPEYEVFPNLLCSSFDLEDSILFVGLDGEAEYTSPQAD